MIDRIWYDRTTITYVVRDGPALLHIPKELAEAIKLMFERILAFDWSGDQRPAAQRRAIQVCIAQRHASGWQIGGPYAGRTRSETLAWLHELLAQPGPALIGFDFAFGFPTGALAFQSWEQALVHMAESAEQILQTCPAPFWGRGSRIKRDLPELLRRTERACPGRPASIFQLTGAGQVGPGSLRGMLLLQALRSAGCQVWPFDGPPRAGMTQLVEIYPRLFSGPLVKRDVYARRAHLAQLAASAPAQLQIDPATWEAAADSEHAFDAFVAVLGVWRELQSPQQGFERYDAAFYADPQLRYEGWIFGLAPDRLEQADG